MICSPSHALHVHIQGGEHNLLLFIEVKKYIHSQVERQNYSSMVADAISFLFFLGNWSRSEGKKYIHNYSER
jgi:hypothetical protein